MCPRRSEDIQYSPSFNRFHFNPHNPHEIFGGYYYGLWRVTDSTIIKTTTHSNGNDHIITPREPNGAPSVRYQYRDVAFHPYVDGIYYLCSNEYTKFGTRIESIWKTEDFGQTWRILYDRRDSYFHRIVVNPEKPNIILVATNEGILRTTDGGQEWNFVDNSVFKALSFTDILVDPLEPQTYYCSSKSMSGPNAHKKNGERAGGVYKSTDYGSTWVGMKTDGMHSVSVNYLYYHENPRRLYAGTSAGLYEYLLGKPSGTDGDNKVHTPASPEWTASPNPVRSGENIVIELFGGTADVAMLKLYDATGKYMKTVYAGEIMNTMTISDNTSSYAPGVYFYRLTSKCCHEIRKIVIVE